MSEESLHCKNGLDRVTFKGRRVMRWQDKSVKVSVWYYLPSGELVCEFVNKPGYFRANPAVCFDFLQAQFGVGELSVPQVQIETGEIFRWLRESVAVAECVTLNSLDTITITQELTRMVWFYEILCARPDQHPHFCHCPRFDKFEIPVRVELDAWAARIG